MANTGPQQQFGLIIDSATNEPRRLVDTSDDADDGILDKITIAPDETLHRLLLSDYPPPRRPYVIAQSFGYVPPDTTVVEPPDVVLNRARIRAIVATITSSIRPAVKVAFSARLKTLLASGKIPRFDPVIRTALANEMDRIGRTVIRDSLLNGDTDAPFYVAAVTEALWAEVGDGP